jgi:hypothetical protein
MMHTIHQCIHMCKQCEFMRVCLYVYVCVCVCARARVRVGVHACGRQCRCWRQIQYCSCTSVSARRAQKKHSRVNARVRAHASGREMVTVHGRNTAHLLKGRQYPSASPFRRLYAASSKIPLLHHAAASTSASPHRILSRFQRFLFVTL